MSIFVRTLFVENLYQVNFTIFVSITTIFTPTIPNQKTYFIFVRLELNLNNFLFDMKNFHKFTNFQKFTIPSQKTSKVAQRTLHFLRN